MPAVPLLQVHCFGVLTPPVSQASQRLESRTLIVIDCTEEGTSQAGAPVGDMVGISDGQLGKLPDKKFPNDLLFRI